MGDGCDGSPSAALTHGAAALTSAWGRDQGWGEGEGQVAGSGVGPGVRPEGSAGVEPEGPRRVPERAQGRTGPMMGQERARDEPHQIFQHPRWSPT